MSKSAKALSPHLTPKIIQVLYEIARDHEISEDEAHQIIKSCINTVLVDDPILKDEVVGCLSEPGALSELDSLVIEILLGENDEKG